MKAPVAQCQCDVSESDQIQTCEWSGQGQKKLIVP